MPRTNLSPVCVQATMQQYRTALVRPGCQDEECSAFRDEDGHLRDPADPLTWKFKGMGSKYYCYCFFIYIFISQASGRTGRTSWA